MSLGARRARRRRVLALLSRMLTGDVVLDPHGVGLRPRHDAQEVGHGGDLLYLLLDEPLQELLARVVALTAGGRGQRVDLLGDPLLLLERQRDGLDDVAERRLWSGDSRHERLGVGVEQVLDHHHRVLALFQRLPVEEAGQLRQRLGVVVHRARDVLLVGGELVADLLVQLGYEGVRWHGSDATGRVNELGDPNDGVLPSRHGEGQGEGQGPQAEEALLQVGPALQALSRRLQAAGEGRRGHPARGWPL